MGNNCCCVVERENDLKTERKTRFNELEIETKDNLNTSGNNLNKNEIKRESNAEIYLKQNTADEEQDNQFRKRNSDKLFEISNDEEQITAARGGVNIIIPDEIEDKHNENKENGNEENYSNNRDLKVDNQPENKIDTNESLATSKKKKKKSKKAMKEITKSAETETNESINQEEEVINNIYIDKKVHIVFLVYAPGTNKDEVVFPALKIRGFEKISIGEFLKTHGVNNKDYGESIKKSLEEKIPVNGETIVHLIKDYIEGNMKRCTRYLICGFPKTEENSNSWKSIIGSEYTVNALIYISYTRKEYEHEIRLRESEEGKKFEFAEVTNRFNYFIKNTNLVFDDFGEKKMIKISAKLADDLIRDHIVKHPIFQKNFLKLD